MTILFLKQHMRNLLNKRLILFFGTPNKCIRFGWVEKSSGSLRCLKSSQNSTLYLSAIRNANFLLPLYKI